MTTDYKAWGVSELIEELEKRDRKLNDKSLENDIWVLLCDLAGTDQETMTRSDFEGVALKYAKDIISLIKT